MNAGWNKGADVFAQMIPGKEKPFPVDVGEMMRIDQSGFGLGLPGFTIQDFQLLTFRSGFGQHIECF